MKIGFTELIVVCVVALLVLGPDKLPIYAKKLGKALRDLRGVTDDLAKELNEDIVEPLNQVAQPLKEAADEITKPLNDVKKSFEEIGKPPKTTKKESAEPKEEAESAESREETAEAEDKDQAEEVDSQKEQQAVETPEETVAPAAESESAVEDEQKGE